MSALRKFLGLALWLGLSPWLWSTASAAHGEIPSPEKDRAIEACLEVIRDAQLPEGLIRNQNGGQQLWAVPYFSNIAVMGVLAAHEVSPHPDDLALVQRWLLWYAAHQNPDGTVNDYVGTLTDYASTGDYDSTDSYASTYLQSLWRYWKASPDQAFLSELLPAARKCLDAIELTLDSRDGLTYAKPSYGVKYLMDNIEVCLGAGEGALFFEALGDDASAARARKIEENTRAGLRKFWSSERGYFSWYGDPFDNFMFEFERPYPDALANIFAASYLTPPESEFYPRLREAHAPDTANAHWLIAVRRLGSADEAVHYEQLLIQDTTKRMKPGRGKVGDAGKTLMALLGGEAMWPQIEIDWTQAAPTPPRPQAPSWEGSTAALPATSLPIAYTHRATGQLHWDGEHADLSFDIEEIGCYVHYSFPFQRPGDFSEVRSISFVLNASEETTDTHVQLALIDRDGDVWDLPTEWRTDPQSRSLDQIVHNRWSFPTANGVADLDHITGLRLQISSSGGQTQGNASLSEIRLHK